MADYRHLIRMTDNEGILQFSCLDKPDSGSGYTLDDNARGLMAALMIGAESYPLARSYVNYMEKAQNSSGQWANLLVDGHYYHGLDSQDSWGRAILACSLGTFSIWPDISLACKRMLRNSLPHAEAFTYPRALAYVLIALCKTDIPFWSKKKQQQTIKRLSQNLVSFYIRNHDKNWRWFEDQLTYCNGIIPQAMFSVYASSGDKKILRIANESINFLCQILFQKGYLNIIGNQGWYIKGGNLSMFDQQPVDAASIYFACLEAHQAIGRKEYLDLAILAQRWYYGLNCHGLSLYNKDTGGCYDAITEEGVNLNQGAEALLSMMITDLSLQSRLSTPAIPTEALNPV